MKTLSENPREKNRKKVKRRINFKQRPRLPDNQRKNYDRGMKWQNLPIESWISLKSEDILILSEEKRKEIEKFPPIVRIYKNGLPLRGTKFSGSLLGIDQKKKELIIQPLGFKQKLTRIPIDLNITLELPVIKIGGKQC